MTRWAVRALVACLALSSGCAEVANVFIADSTGDMIVAAAPRLNAQWDYDLFTEGLPSTLILMESVSAVSPDWEMATTRVCLVRMGSR